MEKKITKKDILVAIAALVSEDATAQVGEVTVTGEDIANYVNKTIEQLDNKANNARKRAMEKKNEGDELREAVYSVLTDEFQPIDVITAAIDTTTLDMEDVTKSKVTARLTQLVKLNLAKKEQIKVGDRKIMGYALISFDPKEEVNVVEE